MTCMPVNVNSTKLATQTKYVFRELTLFNTNIGILINAEH
jgi:hypothetical protein